MKKIITFATVSAFLAPLIASAQAPLTDINSVASKATNLGNTFIGLCISFAVLWIIYGVVKYLIAGGEEDREKGKSNIIYGIVGLFIIMSIWGLVAILKNSFKTQDTVPTNTINQTTTLPLPAQVP